jgi:hypothetical protein
MARMSEKAECELKNGDQYPYDIYGASECPEKTSRDWAERAARGVLSDLSDRKGIKWELQKVDIDIRADIVQALADIIRTAKEQDGDQ